MVFVDVWESEEKLNAFFTEGGLGQALEESEIEASPPAIHKLHNMIPQGAGSGDNVLVMIEIDTTTDDYDEVAGALPAHAEDGGGHPAVAHIAAVTDNGKLFVFDLWESPEAFGAFADSQLAPHAEKMGEVTPRFVPVHNVIRGSATVLGLRQRSRQGRCRCLDPGHRLPAGCADRKTQAVSHHLCRLRARVAEHAAAAELERGCAERATPGEEVEAPVALPRQRP